MLHTHQSPFQMGILKLIYTPNICFVEELHCAFPIRPEKKTLELLTFTRVIQNTER